MANKIYWVDNTAGDDLNDGLSYSYPLATVDKAVDLLDVDGEPGDTIRICYTGQDYTRASTPSALDSQNTQGLSWNEGEYFTIEGWDPNGGNDRPTMVLNAGASSFRWFVFSYYADYWKIRELRVREAGINTAWGNCLCFFSSNLYNNEKHFIFERIYSEGLYGVNSSQTGQVIYSYGARLNLTVRYCYFSGPRYILRNASTWPAMKCLHMHNCVFYNAPHDYATTFHYGAFSDETDLDSTFIFENNTAVGCNSTQYTGYGVYIANQGSIYAYFGPEDRFVVRNNHCTRFNYFVRGAVTGDCWDSIHADRTDVGYNIFGWHNSTSQGYFSDAEVFRTVEDPVGTLSKMPGDVIHSTGGGKSPNDITTWFKAYGDATYFWPESGYMTIPDVRPIHPDYTVTMTDTGVDYNGIKGALKSGVYVDTSHDTSHSVEIWTHRKPTNQDHGGSITDEDVVQLMDSTMDLGYKVVTATHTSHAWYHGAGYYGGMANTNYGAIYSEKPSSASITAQLYAQVMHPYDETNYHIWFRSRMRTVSALYNPVGDWALSNYAVKHTQSKGGFPGSYSCHIQFHTLEDDVTSPWYYVGGYTL